MCIDEIEIIDKRFNELEQMEYYVHFVKCKSTTQTIELQKQTNQKNK
jgi:hypothetical protein